MVDFIEALITKMKSNQISSSEVHFFGAVLYLVLLFIYGFYLFKIKIKFEEAGQWNQGFFAKSFFISILGIVLLIFNFFISKLMLFLTNGAFSVFYQEKGLFAQLGFTMFFISFPYCGLRIINVSENAKKIANYLLIGISIIIVFSLLLTILSIFNFISFELKTTMALLASFLSMSLLVSIFLLYQETKNSFSKINKIRIQILIIGLLFILADIIFIMVGFYIQIAAPQYFLIWNNIIQPIQRFVFYLVSILSMYLSFFFPLWLQERTGVLPPSFSKLKEKKRINYSLN